jgi:hypothetical protein
MADYTRTRLSKLRNRFGRSARATTEFDALAIQRPGAALRRRKGADSLDVASLLKATRAHPARHRKS